MEVQFANCQISPNPMLSLDEVPGPAPPNPSIKCKTDDTIPRPKATLREVDQEKLGNSSEAYVSTEQASDSTDNYYDPVETAYKLDKLLCRALEEEVLSSAFVEGQELIGKTFTSVRSEMEYMKSAEGLIASSTLLVEGIPTPTYKPYGMLFDARLCDIKGAYHSDCNSCKDDAGLPQIPEEGKRTLRQLAEEIKVSNSQQMNEVFARLDQPIGLYARLGNSSAFIEVMMVKDYLKKRFKLNLPVYLYNQAKGEIFRIEDTKSKRHAEAKKFSTISTSCRVMARAFESTFVTQASVEA